MNIIDAISQFLFIGWSLFTFAVIGILIKIYQVFIKERIKP